MEVRERRTEETLADTGGFALLWVLFGLAILTSLLSLGYLGATAERRSANAALQSARSLYAAESGLAAVISSLDADSLESALAPGDSLDLGWNGLDSLTEYRAVVQRVDLGTGQPLYLVTVFGERTGPFGGTSRLRTLVTPPEDGGWQYAVHAESFVKLGGGVVDSYNSESGPYGGGNVNNLGNIRVNGDIDFSGSAWVDGDVTVSGISKDMPAPISGTLTEGAPPDPVAAPDCPGGPYTPASDVPTGPGITYSDGELVVGGGNNITLPVPPTQYYFKEVSLTGGSTLTLTTSGTHVDIHIEEKFTVGGGGILNTGADPKDITVWACGASTKDWVLTGGSDGYFAIYAPSRKVVVGGGGHYHGAIIAGHFELTGGSSVHFDESLAGGGGTSADVVTVRGSWTELW